MKKLAFYLLPISLLSSDIQYLLKEFAQKKELSKITKKETAGFVNIYTAQDLKKMQAYTLKDVLQTIPMLTYTKTPNNLSIFTHASTSYVTPAAVRLYINDHDVTSTSFGSAMLIWGDMPIEYIDHIEVYRGSSSIEFGNEPGIIVIKLYTKIAKRENGNKLRATTDTLHSRGIDFYTAKILSLDSTFFGYGNYYKYKAKTFYNDNYLINRDSESSLFYINYQKKNHTFEISNMHKIESPFLGHGKYYHPTGGGLIADHFYINYIYKTPNNTKITLSIDKLRYDREYKDAEGLFTSLGYIEWYFLNFKDTIYSASVEKNKKLGKLNIFAGTFIKHKTFEKEGEFESKVSDYTKNYYNLYSLYSDIRYDINDNSALILSAKVDRYSYEKKIKDSTESILRFSFLHNFNNFKTKIFLTKTYLVIPFYKLCSCASLPFKANPNLKTPKVFLALLSLSHNFNNISSYINIGKKEIKDNIIFNPSTKSYANLSQKKSLFTFEFGQKIKFKKGYLSYTIYKAKNDQHKKLSPDFGVILQHFYSYNKTDIYNQLIYKSSYNYYGVEVDDSTDYTLSIKQHITKDFSIGLRGENLFNTGFKQKYKKLSYPVTINDRRVIFNMEYRF